MLYIRLVMDCTLYTSHCLTADLNQLSILPLHSLTRYYSIAVWVIQFLLTLLKVMATLWRNVTIIHMQPAYNPSFGACWLLARKHIKQDSNVNEEWKSMFGSLEPSNIPQPMGKGHSQATEQEIVQTGKPLRSESSAGICVPLSSSPQVFLGIFFVCIIPNPL